MSAGPVRSGRLAAWGALVALLGVVAALVELLVREWRALVLVLLALFIAGAALWIGLRRREGGRALGIAVALLALVGAVVVLVTRGASVELIVLAALSAIAAVLARAAIRQTAAAGRTSAQRTVEPARTARQGRRAVLLMNPKSGDGKPEKFHLVEEAKRRGIEPVLWQPGQDWRAVARDAAQRADVIGVAGGDGSQAMVAEIAMERELAYVCIPAGTRNHLALDLGLDREDVVGALDAFFSDVVRPVDLAFVNDRIFVNNVSLGIYAEIVQSDAYRAAKRETMETMLPDLLGPRAQPFDLRFRGPHGEVHESAQLILVSNNPYQLHRLAGMGSRPRLDTGQLGIVAVKIENATQAGELLSLHAAGQVRRFRGWTEWSASEFDIDSHAEVAAGIDGEAVMLSPPLRFRIAPAALHVQMPATSLGLSPAALTPTLSAAGVGKIWRIAVGR
jgi:diacylglycerol kinase family enzyme